MVGMMVVQLQDSCPELGSGIFSTAYIVAILSLLFPELHI
jgi:hypothetical protein